MSFVAPPPPEDPPPRAPAPLELVISLMLLLAETADAARGRDTRLPRHPAARATAAADGR